MIRYKRDMPHRAESNAAGGTGTLDIAKLFTLEDTEGCAPVCDVFTFAPGDSIGVHQHVGEGELYYILSGCALVTDETDTVLLHAGDAHYCVSGGRHGISNPGDGPMQMLGVVFRHMQEK